MKIIIQNHRASPKNCVFTDFDRVSCNDGAAAYADMIGKGDSGIGGHGAYDAGFFPAEWVIAAGAIEADSTAKENLRAFKAADKGSTAKNGRKGAGDAYETKLPAPKERGQQPQTMFASAYSLPHAHITK